MINVMFVESSLTGGGSAESLYQHLVAIDRTKFRPILVCLNDIRLVQRVEDLDIPVYVLTDWFLSIDAPRFVRKTAAKLRGTGLRFNRLMSSSYLHIARLTHLSLVRELARITRKEMIDIVHLNVNIYRDLFGLFLKESNRIRFVSHLRSAWPGNRGEFNARMAKMANSRISTFVANSRFTAEYWWDHGIDSEKTTIIHNGVSLNDAPSLDVRREWNIPNETTFVVGCIVPLRNTKKVDEFLLRGFARFLERYNNAVLLVVGEGPMKNILERKTRDLNIESQVIFTGFQQNALGILADVDVAVEAGTYDTLSRVALETMGAGTPLVANDVGAIRELVNHEENGLLIRYGDEDEFTNALHRLVNDEQLRTRLAKNGYMTISEQFSIERYASKIEDIYLSILGK